MTDTTTLAPTDAELIEFAVADEFLLFCDEDDFVQIARAVLAKWGAPAHASGEPAMFAFKYADGTWHDASVTEHSAGMRPLYEMAPPAQKVLLNPDMPTQELRLHMGELTTDEVLVARAAIRWANSQQEARVPLSDAEALAIVRSVPALFTAEDEWLYCIREVEHHHGITAAQKEAP